MAGGLGFAWFLGVPKVRYATPEKQRFWSRFGSQLGGVLAQKGVVFFDACGGFRWSVCVCWVLALNDVVFFQAYGGLCVCIRCFCMLL